MTALRADSRARSPDEGGGGGANFFFQNMSLHFLTVFDAN